MAGAYRPLSEYLRAALEGGLRSAGRDLRVLDAAMERVATMKAFPEAEPALSRLRSAELRLGVLTNSTTEAADRALTVAGLRDRFQVVIGSDEVQTFKPHPWVYGHAVQRLATEPGDVALVAAHGWDVMGAMRVGLRTAWVAPSENWLVPIVTEPDVIGAAIPPRGLAAGAKLAREPGDFSCAR